MYNIKNTTFSLEVFWNMMKTQSALYPTENNFYCFHKRGEKYYVQASNEYDLMFKINKYTDIFADNVVYDNLLCDISDPDKTFETEEQMYKYFVDEHIRFYRELYKYYYEKLSVIS